MVAVRSTSVKRTEPAPLASSWPELVAAFSHHTERADKLRGALWSPVSYCDGAQRSLAGVDQVFAFVADLDFHDLSMVRPHLDSHAIQARVAATGCRKRSSTPGASCRVDVDARFLTVDAFGDRCGGRGRRHARKVQTTQPSRCIGLVSCCASLVGVVVGVWVGGMFVGSLVG